MTKTLAFILAMTTAMPAYAGGPVIVEDTTETTAPDRDNAWLLPVLLGVIAIGLIASGGGDGVSVDVPSNPGPKPCVKVEGGC